MTKTLKISFSLKNTYRVNGILYSIKQIPVLKKILPESLYKVRFFKILANILAVLWEIISGVGGKFLYLFLIFMGTGMYKSQEPGRIFLHILIFLSIAGGIANTYMFNPTKDKYYAMILMRMNARSYTLVNYTYAMLKVMGGLLPFAISFGKLYDIPLSVCVLIPFFAVGMKMSVAAYALWDYEKRGENFNENKLGRKGWVILTLLLAAACILPVIGIILPVSASAGIMAVMTAAGIVSAKKIWSFQYYQEVYKGILREAQYSMDQMNANIRQSSARSIADDLSITSSKEGFEYLNEMFIKRHRKILWKATEKITFVCLILFLAVFLGIRRFPRICENVNRIMLTYLPYFVFIMYCINRGTGFTRALFMNCDRSLLTYSFYKQPKMILKLFKIRLREIIKINLLPAAVIGTGMAVLLYVSGGTDNLLNYAVIIISIVCISVFFSVHYLTIYYLLQPYNAGTQIKSGTYQLVLTVTYMVCFFLMRLRLSTLVFGIGCIVFCIIYCIIACVLVYSLAAKTFRLRV